MGPCDGVDDSRRFGLGVSEALERLRGEVRGLLAYGEEPGPDGPSKLAKETREAAERDGISSSSMLIGCDVLLAILIDVISMGDEDLLCLSLDLSRTFGLFDFIRENVIESRGNVDSSQLSLREGCKQ